MKRLITAAALFTLLTGMLFGHAGEVHTYLGTIKTIAEDQMVITDKNGKDVPITLTTETKYWRGTTPAGRADLAIGTRVSVEIGTDGKSATSVKIAAKPKS